jgi:hypothetical protein
MMHFLSLGRYLRTAKAPGLTFSPSVLARTYDVSNNDLFCCGALVRCSDMRQCAANVRKTDMTIAPSANEADTNLGFCVQKTTAHLILFC